jgi:hypothetical protein
MERAEENPDANIMRIAGKKTCEEWKNFIQKEKNEAFWQEAYNDYFLERLKTRYLDPITAIENLSTSIKVDSTEAGSTDAEKEERKGEGNGEGFSIMAILCTLIEFLEATRQGKKFTLLRNENFRYARQGNFHLINPPFDPNNEYFIGSEYFVNFLQKREPFDKFFADDDKLTEDFYTFIRCGLLHEAQTNDGWKIKIVGSRSSNEDLINAEKKIVYRDNFRKAFDTYLGNYEKELKTDEALQNALIKKFNSLCEE